MFEIALPLLLNLNLPPRASTRFCKAKPILRVLRSCKVADPLSDAVAVPASRDVVLRNLRNLTFEIPRAPLPASGCHPGLSG